MDTTVARRALKGLTNISYPLVYHGCTLFAPMAGKEAYLIAMKGNIVHRWEMPYTPGCHGVLLPNGNLLYAGRTGSGPTVTELLCSGGILLEVDWNGKEVWRYEDPNQHHTFYRQQNGNTMILRWVKTPKDIVAKVKGGIAGTELDSEMWSDSFREVDSDGKVIWEWNSYEHLDPEKDSICPLCYRNEWGGASSCAVLDNGDILTSFTHLNTVCIIDKQTGDIKWRFGKGELFHPTDATMLENGIVLVFDSGYHGPLPLGYSRLVEIDAKGNKMVWNYYEEPWTQFYSSYMSGAQRLPNGNTLICESEVGRIFEITRNGRLVWEYVNPYFGVYDESLGTNNIVFRAYRYDLACVKGREMELAAKPEEEVVSRLDRWEEAEEEKEKKEQEMRSRLDRLGY